MTPSLSSDILQFLLASTDSLGMCPSYAMRFAAVKAVMLRTWCAFPPGAVFSDEEEEEEEGGGYSGNLHAAWLQLVLLARSRSDLARAQLALEMCVSKEVAEDEVLPRRWTKPMGEEGGLGAQVERMVCSVRHLCSWFPLSQQL